MGVSFVGPSPEPPNRAARMHNVVPGAKAYIASLQFELQRAGGTLICDAHVESLERNGDRVAGVRVAIKSRRFTFHARRGVVLAAGDYANNPALIAEFKGEQFAGIEGINPFACGDGHILARHVGARLMNMEITYGPELRFVPASKRPFQHAFPSSGLAAKLIGLLAQRMPAWLMHRLIKRLLVTWQHPENALFDDGAILVNQRGERFVEEISWPQRELAVAAQPEKLAYILLDGRLVDRYSAWPHFISTAPDIAYAYVKDYQQLRPDVTHTGSDLRQAATAAGIDSQRLAETVAQVNAGRGESESRLQRAPWVLLGPLKAWFTTTEGGVAINERLQVLDERGNVIPGLYAVGQNGLGGMILWGHGLHIAWAMTSGRLVGRTVMQQDAQDPPCSSLSARVIVDSEQAMHNPLG
jgi:fumarate reductase flavoprotein subunit